MSKTIKQLADELGVSKQTIQYHLKSLPTNSYQKTDKGTILIKPFGISLIKQKATNKEPTSIRQKTDKEPTNENEYLISQLQEKDKQIAQLHKLLDQQQILTQQANKKIEVLENHPEPQKRSWKFWEK